MGGELGVEFLDQKIWGSRLYLIAVLNHSGDIWLKDVEARMLIIWSVAIPGLVQNNPRGEIVIFPTLLHFLCFLLCTYPGMCMWPLLSQDGLEREAFFLECFVGLSQRPLTPQMSPHWSDVDSEFP